MDRTFWKTTADGKQTRTLGVGSPLPNYFPEVYWGLSQDIDHWVHIAERILRAYRILNRNLQQINKDTLYMRNVVIPDFSENLRARIRFWEYNVGYYALAQKWVELAKPLEEWNERDAMTLSRARALLMQRLLDEGNRVREPPGGGGRKHVWNWEEKRWYVDCGTRFHHRRWDKSVQNEGEDMRNMYELEMADQLRADVNQGVKTVKFAEDTVISERAPTPEPAPHTFYPNMEAFFPYAETPMVDEVMQVIISEHAPGRYGQDARAARRAAVNAARARDAETKLNTLHNKRKPGDGMYIS